MPAHNTKKTAASAAKVASPAKVKSVPVSKTPPPVAKPAAKVAAKTVAKAASKATAAKPVPEVKKTTVPAVKPAQVIKEEDVKVAAKRGRKPKVADTPSKVSDDADMSDIEADLVGEPVVTGEKVKPLRMKISKAKERALMKEFGLDDTSSLKKTWPSAACA